MYVHKLIAETFIKNPKKEKYVSHIDKNKLNNDVNNLKWCSCSEYMKLVEQKNKKLSNDDMEYIRKQKGKKTCVELGEKFGVSFQRIAQIWR